MKPSPHAQAICDLYESDGQQSIFVDAVAGSGKTTLLKLICSRMSVPQRQKAVFCAFNNHIVNDLAEKLPAEVMVKTISSLGFTIVKAFAKPGKVQLDNNKYFEINRAYCRDNVPDTAPAGVTPSDVEEAVLKLAEKAMLTLTDYSKPDNIMALSSHYGIETEGDFWDYIVRAVPAVIERGLGTWKKIKAGAKCPEEVFISFSDMVFLPCALDMTPPPYLKFDNVLVDECQDLNAAQRETVIKLCNKGGRFVFVGDKRQAIYGFAGADVRSVEAIAERTGAIEMPLSVCFRCPKSHVALAKEIVPQIEHASIENGAGVEAIDGEITGLKYSQFTDAVQKGDRAICRTTAPLVKACFELIHAGKPAKVLGRDIGAEVIKVLDRIEQRYTGGAKSKFSKPPFPIQTFDEALDHYENQETARLLRKEHTEMQRQTLNDKCDTLRVIHTKLHQEGTLKSLQDIRDCITNLFASDEEGAKLPILLSSVHKAKGMQGERIFIMDESLMPHPMATRKWEIEQEQNIRYIAFTRSTRSLFFVDAAPKDTSVQSLLGKAD